MATFLPIDEKHRILTMISQPPYLENCISVPTVAHKGYIKASAHLQINQHRYFSAYKGGFQQLHLPRWHRNPVLNSNVTPALHQSQENRLANVTAALTKYTLPKGSFESSITILEESLAGQTTQLLNREWQQTPFLSAPDQ